MKCWTKRELTFRDEVFPSFTQAREIKPRNYMRQMKDKREEREGRECAVIILGGKERCIPRDALMSEEEFNARRVRLKRQGILREE